MDKRLPKFLDRNRLTRTNLNKISDAFNIEKSEILTTANEIKGNGYTNIKSAARYLIDVMNVRIGEEREEIQEQRLIERPMYDKISKFSRKTKGKIFYST